MAPITTHSVGRRTHTYSSSLKMVVSKKDSYKITSLPGDGIGPEIMEATKKVCMKLAEKQGFKIEFTDALIGGAALDACDDPFPDATYKQMVVFMYVYTCTCIFLWNFFAHRRELVCMHIHGRYVQTYGTLYPNKCIYAHLHVCMLGYVCTKARIEQSHGQSPPAVDATLHIQTHTHAYV